MFERFPLLRRSSETKTTYLLAIVDVRRKRPFGDFSVEHASLQGPVCWSVRFFILFSIDVTLIFAFLITKVVMEEIHLLLRGLFLVFFVIIEL